MSYELARNQVFNIVEQTTPTRIGVAGLGEKFTRRKVAPPGAAGGRVGRSFSWWVTGGGDVGYFRKANPEEIVDAELVVFYPAMADMDLLDVLIAQDRLDIITRVLDVSLWGRPTSTIINLAVPQETITAFERRTVQGGYELAQKVRLHHR